MGLFFRLLPLIALVAIGVAVYWFVVRPRRRPKIAPADRGPALESLPSPAAPAWIAPTQVTAPVQPAAADSNNELSVEQLWTDLRRLLKGESILSAQKSLGKDGRFHHRLGLRFTIFHGEGVYVIVRAETDEHRSVQRFVISEERPSIMFGTEPRVAPDGAEKGIAASLAKNTSTDGLREVEKANIAELAFLKQEVADSYRKGNLPGWLS